MCPAPLYRLTMALGTLADAPRDLVNEIRHLEELFTVGTAKLKEITNHFVNELTKGRLLGEQAHNRWADLILTCFRVDR